MMDKLTLLEYLKDGDFRAASAYTTNLNVHEIYKLIYEDAHKEGDIIFYGFLVSLLLQRTENEHSEIHHHISVLLSTNLRTLSGAYDLAEYHTKEALRLEPGNEKYQKYLGHIQSIP